VKLNGSFLNSKVARRIFTLFVVCALVPIVALSLVSFTFVTRQLDHQIRRGLHQTAKSTGMGILERLQRLEAEMKQLANSGLSSETALENPPAWLSTDHFRSLALFVGGERKMILGESLDTPTWSLEQWQDISGGRTLLTTAEVPSGPARVIVAMTVALSEPERGIFVGEIETDFLWNSAPQTWLPMRELFIFDQSGRWLFGSRQETLELLGPAPELNGFSGDFEWSDGETDYLARYWSLFLKSAFASPEWKIVVSEPSADVLSSLNRFMLILPLVILLCLTTVLLLSVVQIRRSLIPLEALRHGTHEIAAQNFDSRIEVESADEFEDLARSFNSMATQLGKQFRTLATFAEIDEALLSTLDKDEIVKTVLLRTPDLFACDGVVVTLLDAGSDLGAVSYACEGNQGHELVKQNVRLCPEEVRRLFADSETRSLTCTSETLPSYLSGLTSAILSDFRIIPVRGNGDLVGVVALGYARPLALTEDELADSQGLVDRLAVALSNARLVEELESLNLQTLHALARTIDAKSPWTAGHSTRLTRMALEIGKIMGLSDEQMNTLYRGGLLHDIGKIGIPQELLDKHGKLSEEEMRIMRDHVNIGARILEPILAYSDEIPIVRYHHEKYDGTGYPEGLAGEEIALGARILAVADVFDALNSDRPYRDGWEEERVVEFIRERAGTDFDPRVVEAFLELMVDKRATESEQHTPEQVCDCVSSEVR
jgi:putative nucleotidyltransferase with HDIG domain